MSGQIWIAAAIAHLAILLGAFFAWVGVKGQAYLTNTAPHKSTQGSFILAAMVGNTGYIGYPVILSYSRYTNGTAKRTFVEARPFLTIIRLRK